MTVKADSLELKKAAITLNLVWDNGSRRCYETVVERVAVENKLMGKYGITNENHKNQMTFYGIMLIKSAG